MPASSTGWGAVRSARVGSRAALALLLVAAGALVAAWVWGGSSDRSAVVVLARNVPYGQPLTAADLAVTAVSVAPGVATVPAAELSSLPGQVAAGNLAAGSLLAPGDLTTAGPPAAGQVLIGLPVPASRLPVGGLVGGDRVLVVDTPVADADPPPAAPAWIAATVVRVGPADLNGVRVVDLAVPAGQGPALAVRAATGRFVLALQPRSAGAPSPGTPPGAPAGAGG